MTGGLAIHSKPAVPLKAQTGCRADGCLHQQLSMGAVSRRIKAHDEFAALAAVPGIVPFR